MLPCQGLFGGVGWGGGVKGVGWGGGGGGVLGGANNVLVY